MKGWPIPAGVGGCLDTLRRTGHAAYPMGGCVRDLLLGRTSGNSDMCTDARPEQVMELFPHTVPTGLRHGTVTVRTEDGSVEVTTFRREAGYADGHHPDAVDSDATPAEDLARRDFTVNAMALDENGMAIDRYGGQMDLLRNVIRCVGDPDRRFAKDTLRMLQAVRFAAQLGFSVEKGTLDVIRRSVRRAEKLPGERIKAELEKILLSPRPELAGELLRLGLLAHLGGCSDCPGLLALREEPPEPVSRQWVFCRLTGFPIAVLPVEQALRRGVLHPEAEAVRTLVLSGGELTALGLGGPAIDAAQRRLTTHILAYPEDNTPVRLLTLARAELNGSQGWLSLLGQARTPSFRHKHQGRGGTAMERSGKREGLLEGTAEVFDLPGDVVASLPRVKLTGNWELWMENHKGVLSYGGEEIHISGGKLVVKVRGSGLELWNMNVSQLLITGVITAVELE